MKSCLLGLMSLATVAFADASYDGESLTLTLDGVITNVTTETELDPATNIVMTSSGGVAFADSMVLAKKYSVTGSGTGAYGVMSVASGKKVTVSKALFYGNSVGKNVVKRGAGELLFNGSMGVVSSPTRWTVEEGVLSANGNDYFGGHDSTTTNLVIDVREGAYYTFYTDNHSPIGQLELTGGQFICPSERDPSSFWGNTAFKGGVVAHACATPSLISLGKDAHLGHYNHTNIVFNVETGAKLVIYGGLKNGWYNSEVPCQLIKRGGGELVLLGYGTWTGGTLIEGGTITVGATNSLGTSAIKLQGDATLNVLGGVSITCPEVTGSGTLIKVGDGAATFPTVGAGVTITRADGEGTLTQPFVNGTLYLTGWAVTVNVPDGETYTVTSISNTIGDLGISGTDLIKTGAGTLVLPNTDNTSFIRKTSVQGGTLRVAAQNNFGSGDIRITNGAVVDFTAGFTFTRKAPKITISGAGGFCIPSGATVAVYTNTFYAAGATFTKTGAGTFSLNENHYHFNGNVNASTRLICEAGVFQLAGDPFGGHTTASGPTLEVQEGATIRSSGHSPLMNVVMRGGTLQVNYANNLFTAENSSFRQGVEEIIAKWIGISFNGTITVLPSRDGSESVIKGVRCYLGHHTNRTVFNVTEGAKLRCDARICDGFDSSSNVSNPVGFTKLGKGEMILGAAVDSLGTIYLNEGTIQVGTFGSIPESVNLQIAPGATLSLADGTTVATGTDAGNPVLASADVWFDATRLKANSGESVLIAPNYGTAGGLFKKANAPAPTFKPAALNGLPAIHCDGGMGLVLDAFTNYTATLTVFMVAEWTSWDYNAGVGGMGHWGGGLSLSRYTATDNDNATAYSFHTETASTINNTSVSAPSIGSVSINNSNRGVGTPYLDMIAYATNKLVAVQYTGDAVADVTASGAYSTSFQIDRVAIGGRLKGAGQLQYGGTPTASGNRMYIGDIGEVLIFTRVLAAEEHQYVAAYLKRKWFNSSATLPAVESSVEGAKIEVADGTGAFAGTVTAATQDDATPALVKSGAGTLSLRTQLSGEGLVEVADGMLELSGAAVASRADVWMDATDLAAITTNAEGKVTAVVNKGRAGGAFGSCAGRNKTAVPYPTYLANAINGNGALVFDANAGLSLSTYTNRTSPRSIHIYAVMQGHGGDLATEGRGKWGGPFSLYDSTQSGDDNTTAGSFQITETYNATGTNQVSIYMGSEGIGRALSGESLADPHLFVAHNEIYGFLYAYEWDDTPANQLYCASRSAWQAMSSDRVNLGGRSTTGGVLQWTSNNAGSNRTWAGYFGELVIVTKKLSSYEEKALLAYLRKKWLNKGDASAATPAFLSGDYGASVFDGVGLAFDNGTALEYSGDAATSVESLTAAGTVDWTRVWSGGDMNSFKMFDVAGDVSLNAVNLTLPNVPSQATLLTWGGDERIVPSWMITGGIGAQGAAISNKNKAYSIFSTGLLFMVR